MAMGDVNNQQNKNQMYENNYFARTKFNNYAERLSVGFSFWKGMLKIAIAQDDSREGERSKYTELVYIHMSPFKAKLMAEAIGEFLKEPATSQKVYGINTGSSEVQGIIAVGNMPESTDETPMRYLLIGKVDPSGHVTDSVKFIFNTNYHWYNKFTDFGSMKFEKVYDNALEVTTLKEILEDYQRSSNGAYAYSHVDIVRYDNKISNDKIADIQRALGIEKRSPNKNSGSFQNSFFAQTGGGGEALLGNNNSSRPSRGGSIDDLESEFL